MTREEAVRERTVERFLECEEKRAEARATGLKQGKSEDDARQIAHEAAKEHWNAWAEDMLAKRKALEESGAWAVEWVVERFPFLPNQAKNAETRAWMEEAEASFSRCLFFSKGGEGTQEAPGGDHKEEVETGSLPVRSIAIDGTLADFIPGGTQFDSATFSGYASFYSATFSRAR